MRTCPCCCETFLSCAYTCYLFQVRIFANHFQYDPKADLTAIRTASMNPILDPWIYILLRRSLFKRLLGLSRKRSGSRSISPPSPHSDLLFPDTMRDSHVFTQLMCNTNIITQLPASVKFIPHDTESCRQT